MFPLSQLRTSTSAGRVRLKSGVMPLPDSTLTPRWARWQNSTITLRRWLWRVTTSPPRLQVVAWLPRRSRAKPGHREHEEPLAVSIPSHHWMEICSSLRSRCRSRPGPVARMQHEVLTQRAAEPCRQVMMLPTTKRTGGPLVSLTVPFGGQVRL